METMLYQFPVAQAPPGSRNPIFSARAKVTSGVTEHIQEASVVIENADGSISAAADNPSANIVGIIQNDSLNVYDQLTTDATPGLPSVGQGVFGSSQEDTGLLPGAPGESLVATIGAPVVVEMSLPNNTGWITGGTYQAAVGTAVGVQKYTDSLGNVIYLADTQKSNKVGTIVDKPTGPGRGNAGDLAARVFVAFTSGLAAASGR